MQRIPIVENVFCHTHKKCHLSHVTVADPDSSDSSRLYPNDCYIYERYGWIKFKNHNIFAQRAWRSFRYKKNPWQNIVNGK